MFGGLFKRKQADETPKASGITVFLLQDRLERFTNEQLTRAMQAAWHRPYDPVTFFSKTLGDEGAVIKMNATYYPIIHRDDRLTSEELGEREIPSWADHRATSNISAKFPGGIPNDLLPQSYWILGVLVAELASASTRALYFQEAGVFVPLTSTVVARMKMPQEYLPEQLLSCSASSVI